MLSRSAIYPFVTLGLLSLSESVLVGQAVTSHYHVTAQIPIGKAQPADFLAVDPAHRRLYGAGDKVIDIDKDSVIGTAPGGAAGGYVFAPDLNRGLARNGTLFDLTTLRVVGKVSGSGDASVYDPVTHRAFLLEDTTTVVDMTTGQVVAKTTFGPELESAVADGQGKLFINREDSAILTKVDAKTLAVDARYPIPECGSAKGLSMDRVTRRLFVGCRFAFVVVNADDGTVVARIPVVGQADANAFDPATRLVFNPNGGSGGVVVIHEDTPDHYSVVDTVRVENEGSLALDETTHKLYVRYSRFLGKPITIPPDVVKAAMQGTPIPARYTRIDMQRTRLMIVVLAP